MLVAAARSWHALSLGDQQLLGAWACTALLFPAWRLAHPRSYDGSSWRPQVETTLRLFSTASPAAVSMSVLSVQGGMAQADRLVNAAMLILSVFVAKGGFWGGMHVSRRPARRCLGARAARGRGAERGWAWSCGLELGCRGLPRLRPRPRPPRCQQGLALSRPWWQQPGAHAAIWWARRKAQRNAAVSSKAN